MSVEKRGRRWRVRYLDPSGGHRSRTFDLRDDAQAFDQEVRRRKQRGTLDTLTAPAETLDHYVTGTWAPVHAAMLAPATRRLYAWAYDTHIGPAFGALEMHRITPALVARWQARMVAGGAGHETVRKARNVLSGILRTAVETEIIDRNAVAAVRAPARPMRDEVVPLSPARVEAIRAVCGPYDAALVSVLAYAGLRPHEALTLRWEHVRDRTLLVAAPKTRTRRTVRLLDPLARDLREWRMAAGRPGDDDLVFAGLVLNTWRRTAWATALEDAGLAHTVPYALRHSFASLLLHEGRSVAFVARQLGHSVTTCLATYLHTIDELEDAPRIGAEDAIRAARGTQVVGVVKDAY